MCVCVMCVYMYIYIYIYMAGVNKPLYFMLVLRSYRYV